MKNNMVKTLIASGFALAVAAGVWSPMFASGDQPKGAQLLMAKPAATETAKAPAMSCPKCKNEMTSHKDADARGANKPTVMAQKHLCPTCANSVEMKGVGKQAKQSVNHTCAASGTKSDKCAK